MSGRGFYKICLIRVGVLKYAHRARILPDEEWNALEQVILDVLRSADVKVNYDRNGSKSDKELYFSGEFWRKAKSLSRDRSVLACTFAHLIAMRRCIEIGADGKISAYTLHLEAFISYFSSYS